MTKRYEDTVRAQEQAFLDGQDAEALVVLRETREALDEALKIIRSHVSLSGKGLGLRLAICADIRRKADLLLSQRGGGR